MNGRVFIVAALAALATGCGARAAQNSGADVGPSGRVIDAEDIAASSARTAWEAVQLLGGFLRLEEDKDRRPSRVTSRGRSSIYLSSEPLLFVDGVRINGYDILQEMSADHVDRIEFISGPSASIRYGTNAGNGVITITTRSPNTSD